MINYALITLHGTQIRDLFAVFLLATIPGAVTQVKIDQVTASTARIGYNPPFGTHDIVESYRIIYKHQNAQGALIENHVSCKDWKNVGWKKYSEHLC